MKDSHHKKVWWFSNILMVSEHTWINIPRSPMASDSSSTLLPFNTMIHMGTIKLSSSNYLLWKSQLLPLLESQGLLGHVDGSFEPPPPFDPPTSQTPNTKHLAWKATDQSLLSIPLASGLMPLALQLISSTDFPHHCLEVSPFLSFYIVPLQIMKIFIHLVVVFILVYVIICLKNSPPPPAVAFFAFFRLQLLLQRVSLS